MERGSRTTADDFGPEIVSDRILDFITRKKDQPFFVFWPTNLPHHEYVEETGKWLRPDVPVLDGEKRATQRHLAGSLASNIAYLDGKLGRIQTQLAKLGIADNTIIIYTADNGTAGYGKGRPEGSAAVRVPFVVGGGGVSALGARDELIDFTDVLPTLLDLSGACPAAGLDGRSFAPLLRGEPFSGREWIYSSGELQGKQKGTIGRWIRDERWLLDAAGQLWDCGDKCDESEFSRAPVDAPATAVTTQRLQAFAPKE